MEYPEIKAARAYGEALSRHTSLLAAFERSLRVTDELYRRLERDMYAGMAYKGADGTDEPGSRPTQGTYNAQHAKDAVALSRALSQAGAVHARLLENEAARADSMSQAEKVRFMVGALRKLPMAERQRVAAEILAA
jgi:hypothetical protein